MAGNSWRIAFTSMFSCFFAVFQTMMSTFSLIKSCLTLLGKNKISFQLIPNLTRYFFVFWEWYSEFYVRPIQCLKCTEIHCTIFTKYWQKFWEINLLIHIYWGHETHCGNLGNILSCIFGKNFVKATFLLDTVWKSTIKCDHDFYVKCKIFPSNQSKIELLANFTNKIPWKDWV